MLSQEILEKFATIGGPAVPTGIKVNGFNLYYKPYRNAEWVFDGGLGNFFIHTSDLSGLDIAGYQASVKWSVKHLECHFRGTRVTETGEVLDHLIPILDKTSAPPLVRHNFDFKVPQEILDWISKVNQQVDAAIISKHNPKRLPSVADAMFFDENQGLEVKLRGPLECLECGAVYAEPGHVKMHGMSCDKCDL